MYKLDVRAKDRTGEVVHEWRFTKPITSGKNRQVMWEVECLLCGGKHQVSYAVHKHSKRPNYCGCRPRFTKTEFRSIHKDEFVEVWTQTSKAAGPVDPLVPWNRILDQIRYAGKKRGFDFSLTGENIKDLCTSDCVYCGEPPSNLHRKTDSNRRKYEIRYNGLDRVDNERGYHLDNVVPCCKHCNIAKRDRSKSEFLEWVKKVYENSGPTQSSDMDKKQY